MSDSATPNTQNACLVLADGTVFFGKSLGANQPACGEICFNTGMTGYQEILTDPSYTGQIITFTFPHIGNVGCNDEDIEAKKPSAAGLVLREKPTLPSNFRSKISLDEWLIKHSIAGIYDVDTRALTKHIRKAGAQNAVIIALRFEVSGFSLEKELEKTHAQLKAAPQMKGLDLAKNVTTAKNYEWSEKLWQLSPNSKLQTPNSAAHIVAIDYGAKYNILRHLAERGLKITVVPAQTSAKDILALKPEGIFLSNGPGDPAATGVYALPVIRELMESGLPIFGICLGHQLLGLAMGGKTEKMAQGHRGMNHPVKHLPTGKVEITSQNHGFVVSKEGLPAEVEITHISLFDGTIQGIAHKTRPIFSVQGHPEASPGPHDSAYLFDEFVRLIKTRIQDSGFGIREVAQ